MKIKLDDEDYDKIMSLGVPRIYLSINHSTRPPPHGSFCMFIHTNRQALTTVLFGKGVGYHVDYDDGDFLNLQQANITMRSNLHRY